MEWIKCSERMPERGLDVLVYCPDTGEQFVAANWDGGLDFQYARDESGNIVCEPSHWMRLPHSPTE